MAQSPRRSQPGPRTHARRIGQAGRAGQPTPAAHSKWSLLGPLILVLAIATLALVALPGLTGGGPTAGATPGTTDPVVALATGARVTDPPAADGTADETPADAPNAPPTDPGTTTDPGTAPPTDPDTTPGTTGSQGHPRPVAFLRRRLDNAFRTMAKEVGAPGLAAAVKLPDGSVWYGVNGVLWPHGPAVTVDTPFAWGSITKTFVASLVLRAASQGKLNLDQTIDAWLPDFPSANRISVRMLLAHTSGIADYFQSTAYNERVFDDPTHAWTTDEILAMVGPRLYPPGQGFNYSNTNYVLLGLILEQITGQPLATLVRDTFLVPLGMDDTVFQQAGQPVDLVGAKGFWKSSAGFREWSDGTNFRPTTSTATVAWAAGALEGSVRDLLDWEMALYGGQVLDTAELGQMLSFSRSSGYGLGARTQTLAKEQGYGHGGSLRGFVSVMYRLPKEDLDVVVLTNVGYANLDKVANRLAKAALTPLPTPQPSALPSACSTIGSCGSPPGTSTP